MLVLEKDVERAKKAVGGADARANDPAVVVFAQETNRYDVGFDTLDDALDHARGEIELSALTGQTSGITEDEIFAFCSADGRTWHAGTVLRAYHFKEFGNEFGPEYERRWNPSLINGRLGGLAAFKRDLRAAFERIGALDKQHAKRLAEHEKRVNAPDRQAAEREMDAKIAAVRARLAENGIVILPGVVQGGRLCFGTAHKPAARIGDHAVFEVPESYRKVQMKDAETEIAAIRAAYAATIDTGRTPVPKHQSFLGRYGVSEAMSRILTNTARVVDVNHLLHALATVNMTYGHMGDRGGRSGLSNLDPTMQYLFDAISLAYGLDLPAEMYFWCFDHEDGPGLPSVPFVDSVVFTHRETGHDYNDDHRFPWHEVGDTSAPRLPVWHS